MIAVDQIRDIVKAVIFSGYIKKEQPLSLLIIALPESGKTTILKSFYNSPGILKLSDATAYGIIKATDDLHDVETGKVKHILIPDLITPLSKRHETSKSFVSFMNGLIEEGIIDISTYATNIRGRKSSVRCGLLSTVTPDYLKDQRHGWLKMGFLSRMLPISYAYSNATAKHIFDYIATEKHLDEQQEELDLPIRDIDVELNEGIAKELIPFVANSVVEVKEVYGFRLQRQTQTLLKSCALIDGRTKVNEDDKNKVLEMLTYVNLNQNAI